MSSSELLVVRATMKPLATLNRPTLKTVDVLTKQETVSFGAHRCHRRAGPGRGGRGLTALVLADEATRKFGSDSVAELVRNRDSYLAAVGDSPVG